MPLRSDWASENCPIARSLEVLGDPWVMLVLRQAFSGVRRFEQFRTAGQTGSINLPQNLLVSQGHPVGVKSICLSTQAIPISMGCEGNCGKSVGLRGDYVQATGAD